MSTKCPFKKEDLVKRNFKKKTSIASKRLYVILARAAFAIALVMELKNSTSICSTDELLKCKRSTGNHTTVLLSKLKQWISDNSEDATFKYYAQMVTFFCPMQQMFCDAIRYGDRIAREAS